ncbi:hypothetical protein BGX28_009270 [Mortierella sp. GBA30]|nr:hypothetical protein BGX28_009270 [Mortierella sp. GBA30]
MDIHQEHGVVRRVTLPNECLYLVISHLHDDIQTLRTLLRVNRMFFDAALPLLFNNPFQTWNMNFSMSPYVDGREPLFTLVLASLLQYQGQRTRQSPQDLVKKFGLELVMPVSSEYPMLQAIFAYLDDDQNPNQRDGGVVSTKRRMITIDYSTYFTVLETIEWRFVEFHKFIRLLQLPAAMLEQQNEDHGNLNVNGNHNEGQDGDESQAKAQHTEEQQLESVYRLEIEKALTAMVLHYNFEYITSFEFHASEAAKHLPLAPKMRSLRILALDRDHALPETHLQDIVSFIRQNQEAHPRKPPLDLEPSYNWGDGFDDDSPTAVKRHGLFLRVTKPMMALYEAVGRPPNLNVTNLPNFHLASQKIDLDRLTRFADYDEQRIDSGEGPGMEKFLRRCHQLQTLDLTVGHPFILSWAAQQAQQTNTLSTTTTTGAERKILQKVEMVDLTSDLPYRFLVHATNDAMTAFAGSLKSFRAYSYERTQQPAFIESTALETWVQTAVSLRSLTVANSVGKWPFQLPLLKSLHLDMAPARNLQVGSFDQCPNLEDIFISFGGPGDRFVFHNSMDVLEAYWQDNVDVNLFPKWNLPRLKNLKLADGAALRFDYESLESMKALESIDIAVDKKYALINDLHLIPRLSEHIKRAAWILSQALHPTQYSQDDNAEEETTDEKCEHKQRGDLWRMKWTLPKLTKISMSGPPAMVFDIHWLNRCPSLKKVDLVMPKDPRLMIPALSSILASPVPPFRTRAPGQPIPDVSASWASWAEDADDMDNDKPYLDSRLESIRLKGFWHWTASDLTRLLTVQAPHLQKLTLDGTRPGQAKLLNKHVKALLEADTINEAFANKFLKASEAKRACSELDCGSGALDGDGDKQETEDDELLSMMLPGTSLTLVEANFGLRSRDVFELGLVAIKDSRMEEYREHGLRVYRVSNQYLVSKADEYCMKQIEREQRQGEDD